MQFRKLSLFLCLLPVLSGCDGGASFDVPGHALPQPTAIDRISGTWRVRSYSSPSGGLQQCPSSTVAFSCTDNTRWVFRQDKSMTDANGVLRTYDFDGTTLTYFGQPANSSLRVVSLTDSLLQIDFTDLPLVNEKVSVLFEKQ